VRKNKKHEILQVISMGKRGGNTGIFRKRLERERERESRWKRVARFRLGNEMREGRYSEEETNRLYSLCGNGLETRGSTFGRNAGVGGRERERVGKRYMEGEGEGRFR